MNFDLSDDQRLLHRAVEQLFASHETKPKNPSSTWEDYRILGLLCLPFPADLGGLACGHETMMLVMEAYGGTLARAPYLQSVLLAGGLLADLRPEMLEQVLAGAMQAALCLYEPGARYRWEAVTTRATPSGDGWRLSGAKCAVLDGDTADMLLVPAATAEGLRLFLVPSDTIGVARRNRPTPDGRGAADIDFDAILPADAALSGSAETPGLIGAAIDRALAACCAEAVGAMERLLGITTNYLNTRRQFNAAIGSFQALQHRAADMLVALEQARSMSFYAVSMLDAPARERSIAVAAAKAFVDRAGRFVGSEAIQLHGGMGLASEYPAGRYFQRLTMIGTMLGDTDHLLAQVEAGGGLPA